MFFREYVGDYLEPLPADLNLKPFCPEVPTSLLSMDHLVGVRMRDQLQIAPEGGLKEAFQGILHNPNMKVLKNCDYRKIRLHSTIVFGMIKMAKQFLLR